MEITITAILKAQPGKKEELRQALDEVIPPSRQEEGCLAYVLHESIDAPGTFVFYEKYRDETALTQHINSAHYQAYRKRVETLLEVREVYRLYEV
ncbi:putative quinol monooxygenase [Exiguobacterium sp. AM39-5BH]|uniref:putative quinol monooxygenase n=1 Tax=Exiguobacterium sp. AM39-5BH TaxID=2292355 RepID=UPI000FE21BDE|nr:putative quinol monooxygenase [Exiguobacterium sp. AM39-5BH]RHB49006.1 antibiotic biosynthesis monooxygenase [Exiguobacterium sp. AM39-5BH]